MRCSWHKKKYVIRVCRKRRRQKFVAAAATAARTHRARFSFAAFFGGTLFSIILLAQHPAAARVFNKIFY